MVFKNKRRFSKSSHKSSSKRGMVKLIKKVITDQSEQKFSERLTTNTNLIATVTRVFTDIIQGDDADERVGIEIQPDSLNLRVHAFLTAGPAKPVALRIYIIQNMVLDDAENLPASLLAIMPNLAQSKNPYRILYDRFFDMSLGAKSDLLIRMFIKGSKMKSVKWSSGVATAYTQGKITLHMITDNDVTDLLTVDTNSRLNYHDN